jgi:hypothetical protein
MVAFEQEQMLRAEGWRGRRSTAGSKGKRTGEARARA